MSDFSIRPLILSLFIARLQVWRFPQLAKDFGGGAFFIPYIMAFFLIGLPTLILEISLGQCYQVGNVGVFGKMHRRYRGVGVASVVCGFILVTYYSMLLSWVANGKSARTTQQEENLSESYSNIARWFSFL